MRDSQPSIEANSSQQALGIQLKLNVLKTGTFPNRNDFIGNLVFHHGSMKEKA